MLQLVDLEIEQLAELGRAAAGSATSGYPDDLPKAEIERLEAERRETQGRALEAFKALLIERDNRAWWAGSDFATGAETQRQTAIRSVTLLLVVLAVVSMPIIAMIAKLDPEAFGTFIAPITAIAGTVVGFWFSSVERKSPTS